VTKKNLISDLKLEIDEPISSKDEDKLYYEEIYVESIYNILESNNKDFSFGIFGNYGSGKSGIIKLLENRYEKDNDIVFINTSVWGYEPIEFIRKLLKNLNKELNHKKNQEKFNESLYSERIELDNSKIKMNNNKIFNSLYLFLGIISILSIIWFIILNIYKDFDLSEYLLICFTFLSPIATLFIAFLIYRYGPDNFGKKTIHKPIKIDEFQNKFEELLNTKQKRKKIETLILVIDDLDRCNENMVVRVLEILNCLIRDGLTNDNLKIKILLPFSLTKYQDERIDIEEDKEKKKDFDFLMANIVKFLDSYILLPSQSELGLYKIFNEVGK
jgi:hypothetical protein